MILTFSCSPQLIVMILNDKKQHCSCLRIFTFGAWSTEYAYHRYHLWLQGTVCAVCCSMSKTCYVTSCRLYILPPYFILALIFFSFYFYSAKAYGTACTWMYETPVHHCAGKHGLAPVYAEERMCEQVLNDKR